MWRPWIDEENANEGEAVQDIGGDLENLNGRVHEASHVESGLCSSKKTLFNSGEQPKLQTVRVIRNVYYYFKVEQKSHSFVKTSDATGVSAQSRGLLPQIKFVRHQEKKGDRSENGSSSKSTTSL